MDRGALTLNRSLDATFPVFLARMFMVAALAVLTAAGAYLRIPVPFTPVPITLQTFFVFLSGLFLGGKRGAASQLLYVSVGAAGLSVFCGGGGLWYLLRGVTGGYLAGFIAGAAVIGWLKEKKTASPAWIIFSLLAGAAVIYLFGLWHLQRVTDLPWPAVFAKGLWPFLPGMILKITAAAALYKLLGRHFLEAKL